MPNPAEASRRRALRVDAARLVATLAAATGVAVVATLPWGIATGLAVWIVAGFVTTLRFRRWCASALAAPPPTGLFWNAAAKRLHRGVHRARRRTRRLVSELRWLQDTLDSMPDGWLVLQPDGAIEALNEGARSLLGLGERDRRRHITDLVRDQSVHALIRGEIEDGIIELPSPVDEVRRLELRHFPVDEDRSIALIRDVTTLDRLLTMRQDFIANVSHELRTPLTVVIGYLETLEDDDIDPETLRRLLDRLHAPVDRMKALVDDLLTLTRLESSPMPGPGDVQPIHGHAMLKSVVDEAAQLTTPTHRLALEADPELVAHAVPSEIYSAFFNLVANAIRYSPDGGEVTVRWRSGEAGARFEVEDNGLGIPPEHISRLTERFFRVDLAKSRVRGGTGLGLAIVKHILRRHRTQLQVRSRLGEGSLFYFDLPTIAQGSAQTALAEPSESARDPQ